MGKFSHLLFIFFLLVLLGDITFSANVVIESSKVRATQCIEVYGINIRCPSEGCTMTVTDSSVAKFEDWLNGASSITVHNIEDGTTTEKKKVCGIKAGKTFKVKISNNSESATSGSIKVHYAPNVGSIEITKVESSTVTATHLMNFTVKVKDLAGNEYTDTSLDEFFRFGTSCDPTSLNCWGAVNATQVIAYCVKSTDCSEKKTITFNTSQCTAESIRYNEIEGGSKGKCNSNSKEANCSCSWGYTYDDKGDHIFRLPAYESVEISGPTVVNICNDSYNGAMTTCTTLGGSCSQIIINPPDICDSSTPYLCECQLPTGGPTSLKKVYSITTTFYPLSNLSLGASTTVTVQHPPKPASIQLILPNSGEAGMEFEANVSIFNKYGDYEYTGNVNFSAESLSGISNFKLSGSSTTGCAANDNHLKWVQCGMSGGTKIFKLKLDKPGWYKITAYPISSSISASADIHITGHPESIFVSAPTEARQSIPYIVTAYLHDAAGNVVAGQEGYVFQFNLTTTGSAAGKLSNGTHEGRILNCTVDPLYGSCSMKVTPTGAPGEIIINVTGQIPGDDTTKLKEGLAKTTIFESQCLEAYIDPPKPTTDMKNNMIETTNYPPVNIVNRKNYQLGEQYIGWDSNSKTMKGNEAICAYGYSRTQVRLCLNSSSGEFDPETGPGLFCLKQFVFTPQVDEEISDHLNLSGDKANDFDFMRKTDCQAGDSSCFYYPKLLWGWGFKGLSQTDPYTTCKTPDQGVGFKVQLGSPSIKALYFNLSATMTGNTSLPTFNMTNASVVEGGSVNHPLSPYEIRGLEALFTLERAGKLKRYAAEGGKALEEYPSDPSHNALIGLPGGMAVDKKSNIYVTDRLSGRVLVFKATRTDTNPATFMVDVIPKEGSLRVDTVKDPDDSDSIKYTGKYQPYGVAYDSWDRIYIVGFTNPDGKGNCKGDNANEDSCNKLVIHVLNSNYTTNTSYARKAPVHIDTLSETDTEIKRDRADIAVSARGDKIYVADSGRKVLVFAFNESGIKKVNEISLYMPCRHLGSGCWDDYCYNTAQEWDSKEGVDYETDACSWDASTGKFKLGQDVHCSSNCHNGVCEQGGTFTGVCYSSKYAYAAPKDTDKTNHQAVAVFYKKGFIFVVDRLTFERKEGYGADYDCDSFRCGGRFGWEALCAGVGGIVGGLFCYGAGVGGGGGCALCYESCGWFCTRSMSYEKALTSSSPSDLCNYCGGGSYHTRTENWIRVYWESDEGKYVPLLHLVIKASVYDVNKGGRYRRSTYDGFTKETNALWGGLGIDGSPGYASAVGWDWNVGGHFGTTGKLGITDSDNARIDGIFVDDAMNIYFPVRNAEDANNGIWRVSTTISSSSASFQSAAQQVRKYGSDGDPGMGEPIDVIVYPDIIRSTLSAGIYCKGCSDKAGLEMDVCQQEQSRASASAGKQTGSTTTTGVAKLPKEEYMRLYLNTTIEGLINVTYPNAKITKVNCKNGNELSSQTGTIWGIARQKTPVLQAFAEGGIFTVVFQRPYRTTKSPAPQVLPNIQYEAYTSRLFTKHFVVLDNVKGKSDSSKPYMANSSYHFNYTRWNNSYYGYEFITTNVDIYENVSPKDPSKRYYDVDAQKFFDGSTYPPTPYWAGYENTSLIWQFQKAYNFYPMKPSPNQLSQILSCGTGGCRLVACASKRAPDGSDTPDPVYLTVKISGINSEGVSDADTYSVSTSCAASKWTDGTASTTTSTEKHVICGGLTGCGSGYTQRSCTAGERDEWDCEEHICVVCEKTITVESFKKWTNISSVEITGVGNDANVKICAADDSGNLNCASGAVYFNKPLDKGPSFDIPGHTATYPYIPAGSSYTTPSEGALVPADEFPKGGTHLMVVPIKVNSGTSLTLIGENATGGPVEGFVAITGDMPKYPVSPKDPLNSNYTSITFVRGSGAEFGDEFQVIEDSELIVNVVGPLAFTGDTTSMSLSSQSIISGIETTKPKLNVSSHKNICCNHSTVLTIESSSTDICANSVDAAKEKCKSKYPTHIRAIKVCGSNDDNAKAICSGYKDKNGKKGECSTLRKDISECPTSGKSWYCVCDYDTEPIESFCVNEVKESTERCKTAGEQYYCKCQHEDRIITELANFYPREGVQSCMACSDGNNEECKDVVTGRYYSACNTQNYYTLYKSTANVTIYGISADGETKKANYKFTGSDTAEVPHQIDSTTNWSAVYKIIIEDGANETFTFTASNNPTPLTQFTDVLENEYKKSSALIEFTPYDRGIAVVSNKSSSAKVKLFGINSAGDPITDTISMGGSTEKSSSQKFIALFRIEITDARDENLTLKTTPLSSHAAVFGTIKVEPKKFSPSIYQNASGLFIFANSEFASFVVIDEKILGFHKVNWTFYDRFNNSFIWDQPFDFKLPTKTILEVTPTRDVVDANKTNVTIRARLLYQRIDEPDKPASNPLENQWIKFYEYKVVTDANGKPTTQPEYVRETNDPENKDTTVCGCPENGCYTGTTDDGVSQSACSKNSNCGNNAICMHARKCTSDFDCGGGSKCVDGDYGKICSGSGRCLRSYGFLTALETNADGWTSNYTYEVCGWGRHRVIAVFDPPPDSKYAKSLDIQPYYSGGFPLSVGELSIIAPFAIILLALIGKIVYDWRHPQPRATA